MSKKDPPAILKGILWILFSGTATVCAFLLPAHIAAMVAPSVGGINGLAELRLGLIEKGHAGIGNHWISVYFFILISCALFHSLYRVKTVSLDLGLVNQQKAIGATTTLLFFASEFLAFYVFIWPSF